MLNVNWGIIGSGLIAHKFAQCLELVDNTKLVACSSKDYDKAKDFATKYELEYFYSSYEEMLKNPKIDAVYIATTHNFHYENALLCIKYGKHILCEKAFTVNSLQATEIFSKAKEKNIFVMEGMWARFLPASKWMKTQIQNGVIGDVVSVFAQFGIKFPYVPSSRAFNINLAGGGLLDLGIYPLSFVCNILGNKPTNISSVMVIGETGVDEQTNISLKYESGATATITCSMMSTYDNNAIIYGTKGKILINSTSMPTKINIILDDGQVDEFEWTTSNGFEHEIKEAVEGILAGDIESKTITAADTIEILEICDDVRKTWNFEYPDEYEGLKKSNFENSPQLGR